MFGSISYCAFLKDSLVVPLIISTSPFFRANLKILKRLQLTRRGALKRYTTYANLNSACASDKFTTPRFSP